uniref:Uncharacterized protein n=1 Tax=Rhizophora mucronata TaxID=61149 RepID=A0A2P2JMF3_RHIMU
MCCARCPCLSRSRPRERSFSSFAGPFSVFHLTTRTKIRGVDDYRNCETNSAGSGKDLTAEE